MINVTSQTGTQPPTVEASSYYGSFGTWHYGMKATGAVGDGSHAGDVDYTVSTNRFTTHGYRDHSGARKNLANARLGVRINDVSKLTLLLNSVDIKANDAGGLTADEWRDNPRQCRAATSIIPARIPDRPRPACAMSASSVPRTISAL